MRTSQDERLFNVDVNGARVATGILRDAADVYLDARRAAGVGSCYVYLADKPAPLARKRHGWNAPSIPRLPSMRVSAAERQKLTGKLLADGTLRREGDMIASGDYAEQVAA